MALKNRMGRRNCCRFSKQLSKQPLIGTRNNPSPQHDCHDPVSSHSSIIGVKFVDPASLSNQSNGMPQRASGWIGEKVALTKPVF